MEYSQNNIVLNKLYAVSSHKTNVGEENWQKILTRENNSLFVCIW